MSPRLAQLLIITGILVLGYQLMGLYGLSAALFLSGVLAYL